MTTTKKNCFKGLSQVDMMELMKHLYGHDEVADSEMDCTCGTTGTGVVSGLVESSSCLKGVLPQNKQRRQEKPTTDSPLETNGS